MTMPPPPFHPDPVEAAREGHRAAAATITTTDPRSSRSGPSRSTTKPMPTRPIASEAQNNVVAPPASAGSAPRASTITVASHWPVPASSPQ